MNPDFIILFGSFAKGLNHQSSDIDLAYFSHTKLSTYERSILMGELSVLSNCEVDLIDSRQIDTVFTKQIFEHGFPICIQDENEFYRQKMRAYSMFVTGKHH